MGRLIKSEDLQLPLDFVWYDMIVAGDKREEYREITAYWVNRLLGESGYSDDYLEEEVRRLHLKGRAIPENVEQLFRSGHLVALPYKTVTFRRGYTRETVTFRITGIDIRQGNPNWGAKPGRKYLVISFKPILKEDSHTFEASHGDIRRGETAIVFPAGKTDA